MKKTKIFAMLMVGIIIFLVAFTSIPNLVSGKVRDGKVELNDGLVNREILFDKPQHLSPSQVVSTKEIKIKNTGDLSLRMFERFSFQLENENIVKSKLNDMLHLYYVKPQFFKNGNPIKIDGLTSDWIKVSEFNRLYNIEKDQELTIIDPGDTLSMKLDIKLDENADNSYQNALLTVDFIAGGLMSVLTDGFTLPDTATNSFNFMTIGLLLILTGGILYFIKSRKKTVKE